MRIASDDTMTGATGKGGYAVVVVLVVMAILLVLVAANGVAVRRLQREVEITDRRQRLRLEAATTHRPVPPVTDAAAPAPTP